jgi:hypothetical protein
MNEHFIYLRRMFYERAPWNDVEIEYLIFFFILYLLFQLVKNIP